MKAFLRFLALLVFITGFSVQSFSQTGKYDVRFNINELNCADSLLYVDIEVRANELGAEFNISEQNYRFSFNREALANPQEVQELVLSQFVVTTNPPSSSFYSDHTLTGSLDTVVSYNFELSGGDGYPLNDVEYVKVGRISFDILDFNSCIELTWHTHDPADFPPTFIGENFNALPYDVAEGSYGEYKQCLGNVCDNLPPVAADDSGSTPENTPISIDLPTNDSDSDGVIDPTSVTLVTTPPASEGTVTVDPVTGEITFTPANGFNGSVTPFDYQICDGGTEIPSVGGDQNTVPQATPIPLNDDPVVAADPECTTATVSIEVISVNDPPSANPDSEVTNEDLPVPIDVVGNDSDPEDGSPLDPCNVTITTQPANGTIAFGPAPTCILTYTPNLNFNGVDTFEYEVCDFNGDCDTAMVDVTVNAVNDPPVAVDDEKETDESTPVEVNVVANDSDIEDGTPLESCNVTITIQPANGNVVVGPPASCTLTYLPDNEYTGTDTFEYQVCDSGGECDLGVVTITIAEVNDPPVAVNDFGTTPEDTPVTVPIIDNDSDSDGNIDPATVTITTPPTNGSIVINPDGSATYTPNPEFNGVDIFVYQVCDDGTPLPAECDDAIVEITVDPTNDAPVAEDDSKSTEEDTPIIIDVVNNDSDVEDGTPLDPCAVTVVTPPANGTVSFGSPPLCVMVYTPDSNFDGTDTFVYEVCDSEGECDTALVTMTIDPVNDPPEAVDDSSNTQEDTPVVIPVTSNDLDAEDGAIDPCSVVITSQPSNGTITTGPAPGCELTYTPNLNYTGLDEFEYQICDSDGLCDTATVNIDVGDVNDPPVTADDTETTEEDTPVVVDVVGNDSDTEDGSPLDPCNVSILTPPANGTITFGTPPGCSLVYTPDPEFNGEDSFVYEVCDSGGECESATGTITVNPVNDPPVAQDDNAPTDEDTPVVIPVDTNDSDVEETLDPCNVSISAPPTNGTVTIGPAPDCVLTYTPDPDYNGTDTFEYTICDSEGACDEAVVTVPVGEVNDPPVAADDSGTTVEETPVVIDVVGNDSDLEDGSPLDPCSVTIVTPPANGTVTFGFPPNCIMVYTPNPDFAGPTDSFVYEVCDSEGLCDTAVVTVTVDPVNDPVVAEDDDINTPEDMPVTIPVTDNDTDVDGNVDPSTVTVTDPPTNGTVTVNPDGTITYTPDPDFDGTDTFTYEVCDDGTPLPAECDEATVTVTVDPVNDPIVAEDDDINTPEDMPVTIPVTDNDTDEDGNVDPSTVTVTDPPTNGTTTVNPDGTITYTPDPDFDGTDTFTYEVCDDGTPLPAECDEATVTVTVDPVNDPIVAEDDDINTPEDMPVTIPVTDNDTDEDGNVDPSTVTITDPPTNGTVTVNPDGTITYTPDPDFNGTDTFTYEVCDDGTPLPAECDEATVTVTVDPVNDAPMAEDDTADVPEETPTVIDVVGNDSDTEDGSPLDPCSVTITNPPTNGTITIGPPPDCELTYTPSPGFEGTDSFEYEVCDTEGACDTADVEINVFNTNDPPVATDDQDTTPEDMPITIPVTGNDSDPDGNLDPSTVTITAPPTNGTTTVNPDGTITYTPDPDFDGTDTFTYEVCDDEGLCDTAVVTVTVDPVNDPIVAEDDDINTPEDMPVTIPVTDNDTDEDGNVDPSTVTITDPPTNGTVTVNPDGTITYTPDPDFDGTDTFTYEVCDDGTPLPAECDEATVTVTVDPVNDPIVAEDDDINTPEDMPITIPVTDNDTDEDGNVDPSTVTITDPPTNGTVTVNPDGTITYTPDPDFDGTDTFTYEVCDDGTPLPAECDEATVTVTVDPVNDPIVAEDDDINTPEDMPVTIPVTDNDTDEDGNVDPSTVTITDPPTNGTVTVNPDGTITYTPDPDFDGTDTFTYEVCDDGTPLPAECDEATVTVTVDPVNDPIVAEDDDINTPEDMPITIPVTDNDTDEDGNVDPSTVTITDPPTNGTVTVNPDGTITYTPDPDFDGTDTFTYEVCDDGTPLPAECDEATVTVTVDPVNDPIVAEDDDINTPEDMPITIPVTDNDTDEDGNVDPSTVTITDPPTNGTVTVNPDGTITYTPDPDFDGTDTFTYEVCDDGTPLPAECDEATVTVTVDPVNDPIVAEDDDINTPEDMPITIPVTDNDTDEDGNVDPSTVTITDPPTNGTVTVNPDGTITYTPDPDFDGTDTFTYEVCDDGTPLPAECDEATVTVTVDPANDAPIAVDDNETTQQDTPVTIDVVGNDSDTEDGSPLEPCNVTLVNQPANGTAYIGVSPDCEVNYVPNPGYIGADTFEYEVCDTGGLCDTAVVSVNTTPCPMPALAISPSSLCLNEAGTFLAASAGAGAIYNWDFGLNAVPSTEFGQGPHVVSFNATGTQQVSLTVLNFGCERTETFDVEVSASPVADISAAPTELCLEELGLFTAAVTFGTGATYTWDFGVDATPPTVMGIGGHAVSYSTSGIKTVTLTVEQNGCSDTFQQDVNVIGGSSADAGPDMVVCNNECTQIGTPAIAGTIYVWSPSDGLSSAFEAQPIACPVSTTTYTLYVIQSGCTTIDMVTVTVDETSVPFAEAGMNKAICEGASVQIGGSPTLDTSIVATATIAWTTDGDPASIDDPTSANPTVSPITSAVYTVCITNNSCTKCDDVTVSVNPLPDVDAGGDVITCAGDPILIGGNPTGANDANFSWSPTIGLDDPYAINPLVTRNTVGTFVYTVTVTREGCSDTDEVTVVVEPCNDPPIAVDDFYETDQAVQLDEPAPGILVNDSDPNGDNLSAVPVDSLQSTVDTSNYITINPDGSFSYFPGPAFSGTDSFEYAMCDDGIPVGCDTAVIYIVVNPCVDVQISAYLEGPYDIPSGEMTTFLNLDPGGDFLHRGLLPGQAPFSDLTTPTPAGQPYGVAPWNYVGTAAENAFAGPYDPDVTDWVLVSLRADPDPTTEVAKAAGLIYKDGHIEFIEPCLLRFGEVNPSQIYIAVEHRNHMGVGSPNPVDFSNGILAWDFRTEQSYITGTGFGQKQVVPGTYAMYCGDSDQISDTFSYDLNGQDNILWSTENGTFDQYRLGDYNLNGDVNGADKICWSINNGISSRWPK